MVGVIIVLLLLWRQPGVFLWPLLLPAPIGVAAAMSGIDGARAGLVYVASIIIAMAGCRIVSARHQRRNNTQLSGGDSSL